MLHASTLIHYFVFHAPCSMLHASTLIHYFTFILYTLCLLGDLLKAMGVNLQMYTISNILMNIHIVSTWIDIIRFATTILTVQF